MSLNAKGFLNKRAKFGVLTQIDILDTTIEEGSTYKTNG